VGRIETSFERPHQRKDAIMKHMVSYTLKPDRVAENERLVAAVYEALKHARPSGLRYATFRLGDGVSFCHIVSHEEADGANALTALPAFEAFAAGIQERCETPPVRVQLTEVGSYGFFGG
jgi:hypothetical protein